MTSRKKQVRADFRRRVFERAGYRCEVCGVKGHDRQGSGGGVALDAHHIAIDRRNFKFGGYVAANGVSLCDSCHLKAEAYHMGKEPEPGYWPHELYELIGSSEAAAIAADLENGDEE